MQRGKVLHQQWDIQLALGQCQNFHWHYIKAIKKVLSELALLNQRLYIAVGRGNHADIYGF